MGMGEGKKTGDERARQGKTLNIAITLSLAIRKSTNNHHKA